MERSSIETIDGVAKYSLYIVSASEPAVAMLLVTSQPGEPGWVSLVVLALSGLHAGGCLKLLSGAMRSALGGAAPSRGVLPSVAALTLVGVGVVGVAVAMDAASGRTAMAVAMLFLAAFTCAVAPMVRAATIIIAVIGSAILFSSAQILLGSGPGPTVGPWYALWAGSAALTYRWSTWMLTLVWDIHRSRQLESRLAVAEERLRFARDLHDTIGRNLTLISITTELAARIAQRTHSETLPHLDEIRRIAGESMGDMREVVGGYRATDLAVEMAGARSLLQSAGIRARVIGDPQALPREVQTALGWVVREAVTNIIRHSRANSARIELDIESTKDLVQGRVTLRIENDGVSTNGRWPVEMGNGLTGLSERLEELGGDVSIRMKGGRFQMRARLPFTQVTDASPDPSAVIS